MADSRLTLRGSALTCPTRAVRRLDQACLPPATPCRQSAPAVHVNPHRSSATREKPSMRDTGEFLFTSESVSEGHPDKVADRLSDTVLDAFLAADPYSRVACETLVTTNRVVLAGETRGPETVTPDLLHASRPHGDPRHRLRPGRLLLEERRDRLPPARAVARHRAGRRCRRQQGRGRRRPGHHVRLRLPRDRRR